MQQQQQPASEAAFTPMRLYFRAEKLSLGGPAKPNACVAVSIVQQAAATNAVAGAQRRRVELGRTEVLSGESSPAWSRSIAVDFVFESVQRIAISVLHERGFEEDGEHNKSVPKAAIELGAPIEVDLGAIVRSLNGCAEFALGGDARLFCTAVEQSLGANDLLRLRFAGAGLPRRNAFNQFSNTYLTLGRIFRGSSTDEKPTVLPIWASQVVVCSLNPRWEAVVPLRLGTVTGADLSEATLQLEAWQKRTFGRDSSLGRVVVSVHELLDAPKSGATFPLRKQEKAHKNYGEIIVTDASLSTRPTFAEYLRAGHQVNLAICIDFTSSNGDYRHPSSLHNLEAPDQNAYLQAITSVGTILMQYDTDKSVPVFGFGAILPGCTAASHFFNVTLDSANAYVHDVAGVVDAYRTCLPQLRLAGPTNFAPCIREVKREALAAASRERVYTVLLLLTDGDISDVQETIDAIVEADDAPLSIIIVGIGTEGDFERMHELDCDNGHLRSSKGRISRRDAVQFVPMGLAAHQHKTAAALAAEVLREVPEQFALYAELVNLPLPTRDSAGCVAGHTADDDDAVARPTEPL